MMMVIATAAWKQYDAMCASPLSRVLLDIAPHAKPKMLRKHSRGPKPPAK